MYNYLIELALIHGILSLAYIVLLRPKKLYTFRRFYLIFATLFAILIPLLKLPVLYSSGAELIVPAAVNAGPVAAGIEVVVAESSNGIYNILVGLYIAVTLFFLFKSMVGILYIRRLKQEGEEHIMYGVPVRVSKSVVGSFSFYDWIFIDQKTFKENSDAEYILAHEQAHINLGHTNDLIFFELFRALFWWVPSSWYINKEIKNIHEFQADEMVIQSHDESHYSSILIHSILQSNGLSLSSSFNNGSLHKRLLAMKNKHSKLSMKLSGFTMSLFALLFVAFACTEERIPQVNLEEVHGSIGTTQEVFNLVEDHPTYRGGMDAFYTKIQKEITYPKTAREGGVEGKVFVKFVVERNGSLSNVKVIKGIGAGCDKEAIKMVQASPDFQAGSQRGRTVRTQMVMPITYQLDEDQRGSIIVGEVSYNAGALDVDARYDNGQWSGTVKDPNGKLMPGTNIIIAGTTRGTVADFDGTFKIEASQSDDVRVSFVGYEGVQLKTNSGH